MGVWRNTTCEIEAHKYVGDGEVVPYNNHIEVIGALRAGEVDVVVIDQLNAMMVAEGDSNLKLVGKMFSDEYYGVVLNREGTGLVSQVNKIMKELKRNGKIDEFERRWILQ